MPFTTSDFVILSGFLSGLDAPKSLDDHSLHVVLVGLPRQVGNMIVGTIIVRMVNIVFNAWAGT
jgi:hypothetical protein